MKQLTVEQYFKGCKGQTADHIHNAQELLSIVNTLLTHAQEDGVVLVDSPATGSLVSLPGGGWRAPSHPTGAPGSAHKQGMAVDIHDPQGYLDSWCMANQAILKKYGLYMEHPDATRGKNTPEGWCHLQSRPTKSGRTVFFP